MAPKKRKCFIGVDVGGTKVLTALLDAHFNVRSEIKSKVMPHKGEKVFIQTIVESIQAVLKQAKLTKKDVAAVGMGCPGMIRLPQGVVRLSPNLSFLKNYPLRLKVSRAMGGVPVTVENDVNAGLYGEFRFGAAKGYREVIGLFLGTGVGGALILNGGLYRGASQAAGEIGHMFLNAPSMTSGGGRGETVESLIGRLRIASDTGLLLMKQQAPALFERTGYDVKKIKSGALAKAVTAGDEAVRDLIVNKAELLGVAMASLVNILSPELIVLGGGLVEAMPSIILPAAREYMKKYAMGPLVEKVKVLPAKLGDYAIVKGAAKLAAEAAEKSK